MKSIAKMMVAAAVMTVFGAVSAQELPSSLNKAADWNKNANVTDVDGVINVKKQTAFYSKKFDIDPQKKYTLKLSVKAVNMQNEKDKSQVYAGFTVFDQKGRRISPINCNIVPGTQTEVVEDAVKGATVIKIKDGSKFAQQWCVIVTGAKGDLSDLPNYNYIGNVKSVGSNNGVWEVTLEKPLTRDVKAGTVIREHKRAGYLYTAGVKQVGKDWIVMSGAISGVKAGTWHFNFWPAGAVKAQIVILANWNKKNLETQFKDISLTAE